MSSCHFPGLYSVFRLLHSRNGTLGFQRCRKDTLKGLNPVTVRSKMTSPWRSQVYLKEDSSNDKQVHPAVFEKCILRTFGCQDRKMTVGFQYSDGILTMYPSKSGIRLEHATGCPCCYLTTNDINNIELANKATGVRVGVSVLVQSVDKHVLITRRSKHLRTFPGVWVPPGGHLEEGELLEEAGLREVEEETGLSVAKAQYGEGLVLGLWESVYPPLFSMGLPKRHHVVVYFLAESNKTFAELNKELRLDESEVDAAAWLDEDIVRKIGESDAHGQLMKGKGQFFDATVLIDGNHKSERLCQTKLMVSAPADSTHESQDFERLSSGTKFALKQWYRILHSKVEKSNLKKADSIGSLFHVVTHEGHHPAEFPFLG